MLVKLRGQLKRLLNSESAHSREGERKMTMLHRDRIVMSIKNTRRCCE